MKDLHEKPCLTHAFSMLHVKIELRREYNPRQAWPLACSSKAMKLSGRYRDHPAKGPSRIRSRTGPCVPGFNAPSDVVVVFLHYNWKCD
jgi:hypothetical protein